MNDPYSSRCHDSANTCRFLPGTLTQSPLQTRQDFLYRSAGIAVQVSQKRRQRRHIIRLLPGTPVRGDTKRLDPGEAGPGHRNRPGKVRLPNVKVLSCRHVLRKAAITDRLTKLRMKGMQNPEMPRSIGCIACSIVQLTRFSCRLGRSAPGTAGTATAARAS